MLKPALPMGNPGQGIPRHPDPAFIQGYIPVWRFQQVGLAGKQPRDQHAGERVFLVLMPQWCMILPQCILQELGGWESIEVVKRYAHLSTDHLADYADRLSSLKVVQSIGTNLARA